MNEREFAELAAGHALHALSDADERRFLQALAAHPEWRAIAEDDQEVAAGLAGALAPVPPPPALRASLLDQITRIPQEGDSQTAPEVPGALAPPRSRSWSRMLFALAASLVLVVGAGIAVTMVVSNLQRPVSVVALDEIRAASDAREASVQLDSGATATAHWSGELGKAVLVASGLEPLASSRTYELWFVRGDQPISAGLFEADAGDATALLSGRMEAGDVIAVTVEPEGGSPTGAPTSDPIIVIPTA